MADTIDITNLEIEVTADTKDTDAQLKKLTGLVERLVNVVEGVTPAAKQAGTETEDAGKKAGKGAKGFAKFGESILRITKYRVIRSVLRAITNAFKEGLGNAYQYSKLTGGEFANSMDRAASSVQYFKNALGAALVPAITALTPLFETLIDYIAELGNGLSNLFANLSGQTKFLAAKKGWREYAKAANEAKSAVLGFDELNIISGGNALGADYENMFEKLETSSEKADELKDKLLSAGIAAGGLMAAFKLAKISPTLAAIVGVVSAIVGISTAGKEIKDIFKWIMDTGSKAFDNFFDKIAESNPDLKDFMEVLKKVKDFLVKVTELAFDNVIDFLGSLGTFLVGVATNDIEKINKGFDSMFTTIVNFVVQLQNLLADVWNKLDANWGGKHQWDKWETISSMSDLTGKSNVSAANADELPGYYYTDANGERQRYKNISDLYADLYNLKPFRDDTGVSGYTGGAGEYQGGTGRIGDTPEVNINLTVELDGRQIESSVKNVEYTNGARITSP